MDYLRDWGENEVRNGYRVRKGLMAEQGKKSMLGKGEEKGVEMILENEVRTR